MWPKAEGIIRILKHPKRYYDVVSDGFRCKVSGASIALLLLLLWQIWGSIRNIISIVVSLFKE